jgi:hypothetical protein
VTLFRPVGPEELALIELAVPSEARRALGYLDQTCKIGAASEALITRIRRFVVRAQWREGLELRVW